MKTALILNGQTLLDIVMQELGDLDRVFEVALLNDIDVTEELQAGNYLFVPDADTSKFNLVGLFADRSNAPASDITTAADDLVILNKGIGYWAIGINNAVG